MGAKSRTKAEKNKEAKKNVAYAKLNNSPSSPRKMRLVADLVRGKRVELALHMLKNNSKQPSERLRKLLLSAIANWQSKNEGARIEESDLFIQEIKVDGGRMLKRLQTAPQGRAHRIRKRSNHVTIILGSRNAAAVETEEAEVTEETKETKETKKSK
jgi:large subunit ribosomal protein L22